MRKFRLKNEIICFAFYGPVFIIYTMLCMVSAAALVFYSFTDWNGLLDKFSFVGLRNYLDILEDKRLITAYINTLKYLVLIPLLTIVIALVLAVVINNLGAIKNFIKSGFFFPSVLCATAVSYIWGYMYSYDIGVINSALRALHLDFLQADWLGSIRFVVPAIAIVAVWQGIGPPMMFLLSALQTIPQELMEAAEIDGANKRQKFYFITVPVVKPTLGVCTLLSVTGALKIYTPILICTNGGPGYESASVVFYIVTSTLNSDMVGYASAVSVVFLMVIALLSLVLFKFLSRNEVRM